MQLLTDDRDSRNRVDFKRFSTTQWVATGLGVLAVFAPRLMGLDLTFWQNVLAGVIVATIVALGALIGRVIVSRSKLHGLGARLSSFKQGRGVASLVAFILGGMAVGALLGAAVWAILPRTAPTQQDAVAPTLPVQTPATPEVYTGYALVGRIPNAAPPGQAELYVLHLNREDDKGGLRIDGESTGDPTSPEVYRCLVRNIGTVAVEEIRLHFTAAFFGGVKPDGGSERSQFYTVSIPPLGAGDGFALYVKNDSPVGVIVNIPTEAEVRRTPAGDSLTVVLKSDIQNLPGPTPAGWGVLTFDGARPAKGTP